MGPAAMRMAVVHAVLLPRLLWGAEVFGMNRRITDKLQTMLNRSLRAIIGLTSRARSNVPSVGLWQELRIDPICALAASRRARAWKKCFTLRSTVGTLVARPL